MLQSFAKPNRIKLADSKRADAALRTSWTAGEPRSTLARCFGESSIHDLDELLVASGKRTWHGLRIALSDCGDHQITRSPDLALRFDSLCKLLTKLFELRRNGQLAIRL